MPNFEWITHRDKRILYMNIATDRTEALKNAIEQLKPLIEKEPLNSILCLVDVTGGHINVDISKALREFTEHNKPYMLMTAVIGITGLQRAIYDGILIVTRRKNLVMKNSREEALDFLSGI